LDIAIDTKTDDDGTMENQSYEDEDDEKENFNAFDNMQEKLFEIIDTEDVADVVDLNQKFLAQSFGVPEDELAALPKI